MSEPEATAERCEQVVPGVWRWHVLDERIDFESDAHAVAADGGSVLIDPLPLADEALRALEPVAAICLTAACHQRSAWRYRRRYGVKVHAPAGSREMDEEPDARYRAGDDLPGGLKAVHTPGPEQAHYAFLRAGPPAVLFCPDLVMRDREGTLTFIPAEYHEDPQASRDSVRRLLGLSFEILCLAHGAPITANPHAELRRLLARGAPAGG
ncbi:MAG TPA: hypothetical protein PK694_04485 [Rhodospirillales bacterium]|nr:hypothetical protein [Rhodospirillales bacterium]